MKKFFLFFLIVFAFEAIANDLKVGDSLYYLGYFEQAIAQYDKCLQQNKNMSNKEKADVYARKATCLNFLGENNLALEHYFESVRFSELTNYKLGQAKAYYNIANLYFALQEYDKSEKYIEQSHKFFTELKDSSNLAKLYGVMAAIYNETKGSREAIDIRLYALKNYNAHFDDYLLQQYYFNLGHSYVTYKADSALLYFDKTLALFPLTQDSSYLPFTYNSVGFIYLKQKNFNKAKEYLELALKTDYLNTDSNQTKNLYDNLAQLSYETGAFKLAYEYAHKASALDKLLFNKEKSKSQTELSEKYEAEKKDAQIAQERKENRLKTIGLIATSIAICLVGLLALFSYRQYTKKQFANQRLAEQNNAIQNLNSKLNEANQTKVALFSVISHDLRAPLSSLYASLQMEQISDTKSSRSTQITFQTEQVLETLENLLMWSKTQLEAFQLNIHDTQLPQRFVETERLYDSIITSKKIEINHQEEGAGRLQTDQDILDIIVRNIFSNALQNAPEHTCIHLRYQLYSNLHIVECSNEYDENRTNQTVFFSERGLGTTLIKDFCKKINATVHFSAGEKQFTVLLKVPTLSHSLKS